MKVDLILNYIKMRKYFAGNLSDLKKELDKNLTRGLITTDVKVISCLASSSIDEVYLFLITYSKEWDD